MRVLIVFFLVFITIKLQSQEQTIFYTERWAAVQNVRKYRLEIADLEEKILLTKEIEGTEATVEIKPGRYKKRLGLLNQKNEVFYYTEWKEFEIIYIPTPKVESIETLTDFDDDTQKFRMKVSGITNDAKIFLREGLEKKPLEYEFNGENLFIEIPTKELLAKNYEIVIQNSEKKFTTIPALSLIKIKQITDFQEIPKVSPKVVELERRIRRTVPGQILIEEGKKDKGYFIKYGFLLSLAAVGFQYQKLKDYEKIQRPSLFLNKNNLSLLDYLIFVNRTTNNPFIRNYLIYESLNARKLIKNYNQDQIRFGSTLGFSFLFLTLFFVDILETKNTKNEQTLGFMWNFHF
ncbi:MAG: hypothetical protein NZ853_04665 [Leptospiraceae bacterium]|nr:hypothetical protein [Leptospiraceae bacterium]MDW7975936.1 hypothetical protein [Leptospiraceae bacterium]